MKKLLTVLVAAMLCGSAFAQTSSITVGAVQPWRVQCDPVTDASGAVTQAIVTVFFRAPLVEPGGAVISNLDRGSVQWDAAQPGTVQVDGKTYTRTELLKAIITDAFTELARPQIESALKPPTQ